MEQPTIISICFSALIAIFIVLPLLALIMHFIVILFPKEKDEKQTLTSSNTDAALYAAISTTYQTLYPGTKVTGIVEKK
ncbi:MAG: hypothetical protein JEY94_06080 [Melioribacteraceae bacterium]|nr:hypothetical protein [Melioribacteraceae bacterium]